MINLRAIELEYIADRNSIAWPGTKLTPTQITIDLPRITKLTANFENIFSELIAEKEILKAFGYGDAKSEVYWKTDRSSMGFSFCVVVNAEQVDGAYKNIITDVLRKAILIAGLKYDIEFISKEEVSLELMPEKEEYKWNTTTY